MFIRNKLKTFNRLLYKKISVFTINSQKDNAYSAHFAALYVLIGSLVTTIIKEELSNNVILVSMMSFGIFLLLFIITNDKK